MKALAFILNLPWTIIGLLVALFSIPVSMKVDKKNWAVIFRIKSWWWARLWMKNARAAAISHVVLLGERTRPLDLEHELIHVAQYLRAPFVHPFLYHFELLRKGYKNNKYEVEAYTKSGNVYEESI